MKKVHQLITAILLCIIITCFSAACSPKESVSKSKEEFLISESVNLTQSMDILADSKEYRQLMTYTDEVDQIIDDISSQDYRLPLTVYVIVFSNDIIKQLAEFYGADSDLLNKMPDTVLDKIKSTYADNLSGILIASNGSQNLVASSMLNWRKSYQQPKDWTQNTMVLLLYDGNYSSLVSFIPSGDGIISATSYFVKNNDLMEELKKSDDASSILEKLFIIKGLEYKTYSAEDVESLLQY